MSSFPISINWQVATPPISTFNSLATSAKNLDSALLASGQKFDQFGQTIDKIQTPLSNVGTGMGDLSANMQGMDQALGNSGQAMEGLAQSTENMSQSIESGGDGIVSYLSNLPPLQQGLDDAGQSAEQMGSTVEQVGGIMEDTSAATEQLGETTEQYTGTIEAMNESQLDAQEGLTQNTELMTKLDETTQDTDKSSLGFNKSIGLLSAGLTAAVGSGISLFHSFTSVRDAQLKVDASTLKLEKSTTTLQTRMNGLSSTTAKMSSDQSLVISGIDEWAAAMNELNTLVGRGITSGSQWNAAMQRASVAQKGLTSATSEGNAIIEKAGIQLQKVGQGADLVAINQLKVQKNTEGLGAAMARMLPDIAGTAGGFAAVVQSVSGAKGMVEGFKSLAERLPSLTTSFGGLSGILGGMKAGLTSLGGILAGLAVPIGLAGLAIGAFVTWVIAIRKHIQVFDDLGAAIGKVFPQAVGFLNDLRAAFISTSDATISSVDWMLGGLDALSGGYGELQANFRKWVDENIKSEGPAKKTAQGFAMMKDGAFEMNSTLVTSQGTFDTYNGNLKDMEGNMIALAGGWTLNEQGAIVVTKAYDENAAAALNSASATENLTGAGRKYEPLAKDITDASQEETDSLNDVQAMLELNRQALQGNVPALINTAKSQTEAALSADDMADSSDNAADSANNLGDGTQVAAEGTANLGAAAEGAVAALSPMDQAILEVVNRLDEEEKAAQKTAWQNAFLLGQWGVEIPEAVAGSREALQALVNIHGEENAAVDESKVKALEYIGSHEGIQGIVNALGGDIIAYAENLGYETDETEKTVEASEWMKKALADLVDEHKKNADAIDKSSQAMAEEHDEITKATQARGDLARKLGIYDEMVKLAIEDQDEFVYGMEAEVEGLQKLAKARGLDTASLEFNKKTLQDYIVTHERLPPTLEDVTDKYTELVIAKQDEAFETELSRQVLEKYIVEQTGLIGVVGESVQVLEALKTGIENVGIAYEEGRASVVSWVLGLAEAEEKAKGEREMLLTLNPALQQFGDLTGVTNEQLKEMTASMLGNREAIRSLYEEVWKASAAFVDLASSTDFREIDDDFEETVDKFREGLKEMIDVAEQNGVEISQKFKNALDFQGVKLLAGKEMQELWPVVASAVEAGMTQQDLSFIDEGVGAYTERIKKALNAANVEGAAKEKVDAILRELANLDTMKDPVQMLNKLRLIKGEIDSLAEGTDGIDKLLGSIGGFSTAPTDSITAVATEINNLATAATDLDLELTPEQINNWAQSLSQLTGIPVDQLKQKLEEKMKEAGESGTAALMEAGPAGDKARQDFETQILNLAKGLTVFATTFMTAFVKDLTNNGLVPAATAFKTFKTNSGAEILTLAKGLNVFGSAFMSAFARDINTHLTTAGSRFGTFASTIKSSMANIVSSVGSAITAIRNLQNAINALKSKTITLTTVIRTVRQTVYAAQGGAFITSARTSVGPLNVSEFGQKELITVTPMEGAGRTPLKGLGSLFKEGESEKKAKKLLESEKEMRTAPRGKSEMVMMRELPIIIQIDGREITRVVNKRLFEGSDSLT